MIAVDLGGTRIRVARFDENFQLLARQETPTLAAEGLQPVMGRIEALIESVLPAVNQDLLGVGICVPGPVDPYKGLLTNAANLPGWLDVPVSRMLSDALNLPVFMGNDANLAALAELHHGAARGFRNIIYLTISTGIGGGIIQDGKLLLGQQGLAGEVGHTRLVINDRLESWEQVASGTGMIRQMRDRLARGEQSLIINMVQGDLTRIDGQLIGAAADEGDKLAQDVIRHTGWLLGVGVSNLLYLFNPEIVILGGGVINLGKVIFEQIHAAIREICYPQFWENLRVVPAALQDNAGLVGAAALVLESVNAHH